MTNGGFTTNGNANVHKTSECWGCGVSIFFDGKTVNPKTGKLQRFDAETKQVHFCDPAVRAEYQARKDIEEAQQALAAPPPPRPPASSLTREYFPGRAPQQQQSTPIKVHRQSQAGIKILEHNDRQVLEGLYNQFVNHMRTHGATIHGVPCAVTMDNQGLRYTMFVFYDIPNENAGQVEQQQP